MAEQNTTTRTVRHALFEYTDPKGVRRIASRGQQIEVSDEDLARGEEHGALFGEDGPPNPIVGPVAAPLRPDGTVDGDPAQDPTVDTMGPLAVSGPIATDASPPPTEPPGPVGPPTQSEPKGVWVDYVVLHGMDRAVAESMTKSELIDASPPE